MTTITLAEASKLGLDDLVTGVIENIVTTNQIYNVMPFTAVDGNALAYNREMTLGDSQALSIGGTITAKTAQTYRKVTTSLTTLIGDAEINGLLRAQNVGNTDLVAQGIASKAKSIGRLWQNLMINGNPTTNSPLQPEEFQGIDELIDDIVAGSPEINTAIDIDHSDTAISFAGLDNLLSQVKSKDGVVDFLMMNRRQANAVRALQRGLGGAQPEYVEVSGINMSSYAGVPIYVNDWIGRASSPLATSVYAGNFDDGSRKVGISGLTSSNNMGIHVEDVGAIEDRDEHIYRVKFYTGLAVFSELSIARLKNVLDQ